MRIVLILSALGWLVSLPWVPVFGYIAFIVAAIVALWLVSVSIERRSFSPWSNRRAIDENYVIALEAMVLDAETTVERLSMEIERLSAVQPISERDPTTVLYHRVGLNSCAPDWLVLAARRALPNCTSPRQAPATPEAGGRASISGG